MIDRISIGNLRGIDSGKVENLAQLSVLTGPNNSGKSTVLEALLLGSPAAHADLVRKVMVRRGWLGVEGAKRLAHELSRPINIETQADEITVVSSIELKGILDADLAEQIRSSSASNVFIQIDLEIKAKAGQSSSSSLVIGENGTTEMEMHYHQAINPPPLPSFIDAGITAVSDMEEAYSALINHGAGSETQLDQLAAALDPTRPRLRIMKIGSKFVLHAVRKEGAVPVYFEGDGFKRLVLIACRLASSAGGLVLLEDPECYLHPAYMGRLASLIQESMNQGTQIVMTTHSVELLQKLFFPESALVGKAALFSVRLNNGVLETNRIAGPRAAERLHELSEDLRM